MVNTPSYTVTLESLKHTPRTLYAGTGHAQYPNGQSTTMCPQQTSVGAKRHNPYPSTLPNITTNHNHFTHYGILVLDNITYMV